MGLVGVMGLMGIIAFRLMGEGVKELMTVMGHMRVMRLVEIIGLV